MWRCSVCRRKMASRVCIQQDSTDSILDVPVLEALQRRHSDAKLGASTQTLAPANGSALAPPRSPELRRHSDVSPAALKELERQFKGSKTPGDMEWCGAGRSIAPSRSNSPTHQDMSDAALAPQISRIASRRGSRVARQHSYDDDMKTGTAGTGTSGGTIGGVASGGQGDIGLGIPSIPRRKSAYDVFAPGLVQAPVSVPQLQRSVGETMTAPIPLPLSRRPSFRVPNPSEDLQNEDSPSPDKGSPVLSVDDDRRMRRRGSQLPDIAALRDRGALPMTSAIPPPMTAFAGPNLEDLEAPRRQTSMDGEAIKIVIHDVDSGPICSSKRRIVLHQGMCRYFTFKISTIYCIATILIHFSGHFLFDEPMIWRKVNCHEIDCYFCLTVVKQIGRHRAVEYPRVDSVTKPVQNSRCTKRKRQDSSSDTGSSYEEDIQDPKVYTQQELNDLIRDLELSKEKSEILASRLRERNLVAPEVKITYYRNRDKRFSQYFSKEKNVCYCKDITGLFNEFGEPYNPDEWRLFIDSSKLSLKAVLLHQGNSKPSIPLEKSFFTLIATIFIVLMQMINIFKN